VKAKEGDRSGPRISYDEPLKMLAIGGMVVHAIGFSRITGKPRRLEEDFLLRPPKKSHCPENQCDYEKNRHHAGRLRGFQWLCMAGNLRQCEFP
jgi:hypothetical protein